VKSASYLLDVLHHDGSTLHCDPAALAEIQTLTQKRALTLKFLRGDRTKKDPKGYLL